MRASQGRPGDIYWSLVEPIWSFVDVHGDPDEFLTEFGVLVKEVGLLFAAHWCQSEVCNGGFHQFFYNGTGVLAPEAVEGFRAIGLADCADIIQQAMNLFGDEYPRDHSARLEALDQELNQKAFQPLDNRFFALLENDRFERAADEYARNLRALGTKLESRLRSQ
jgi:hypothetical protein